MRTCPRRLSRASFGGITRTRQLILMPTDTDLKTIQEKISEVFGPLGCAWASYKLYMAPNSGVGAPNPTAMHNQLHKIILLAHALHCIPETYMFLAPCGWSRVPKNFSKERRRRLQRYSRRMFVPRKVIGQISGRRIARKVKEGKQKGQEVMEYGTKRNRKSGRKRKGQCEASCSSAALTRRNTSRSN